MATSQVNLLAYLSNDADFRSWASGLSAQFAAVGLVQTSNTGQLDLATVNRPPANSNGGYQIWRFNDTLQATFPIFIKIDYGISSAADRPRLGFTVGTSTDGASTITGQSSSGMSCAVGASKTAAAVLPSYCSAGEGRFALVTNLDNSNSAFNMTAIIERTFDASGAVTGDGYLIAATGGSSTPYFSKQVITPTGTVPAAVSTSNTIGVIWPVVSACSQTSVGSNTALGFGVAYSNGTCCFLRTLCYKHSEIGELVSISVPYLGATRIYMPMGNGGTPPDCVAGSAMAIPWE